MLHNILVATDNTHVRFKDELALRLSVPWGGLEEGWILLGERHENWVTIIHAVQAGQRSLRTPSSITFDRDEIMSMVVALRAKLGVQLEPVGIAHTHPPPTQCPSPDDLLADLKWVEGDDQPFIFCISCAGNLSWWLLRAGWKDYEELK